MVRHNTLLLLWAYSQSAAVAVAVVLKQFDLVVAFGDSMADAGYSALDLNLLCN
jgi:phospholipase/lecithinase/hemolysin